MLFLGNFDLRAKYDLLFQPTQSFIKMIEDSGYHISLSETVYTELIKHWRRIFLARGSYSLFSNRIPSISENFSTLFIPQRSGIKLELPPILDKKQWKETLSDLVLLLRDFFNIPSSKNNFQNGMFPRNTVVTMFKDVIPGQIWNLSNNLNDQINVYANMSAAPTKHPKYTQHGYIDEVIVNLAEPLSHCSFVSDDELLQLLIDYYKPDKYIESPIIPLVAAILNSVKEPEKTHPKSYCLLASDKVELDYSYYLTPEYGRLHGINSISLVSGYRI